MRHFGLGMGIKITAKPRGFCGGGKIVRCFVREKKIYCGNRYREVDIFTYTDTQKAVSKQGRSKKVKESEPKQKNLNDKNSRRYLVQLGNLNFGDDKKAIHVTLTYNPKYLPKTLEEAERKVTNYLRKVKYARKKAGLPPLKYILVTGCVTTSKNSDKPVRIHHHIIMNGGLDRDDLEDLWRERRKKGEKKGVRTGYCNADRLQAEEDGISSLCTYLVKQGGKKKKWSSSHNLKKPVSRTNDSRYSRRKLEKLAKDRPGRDFWEKMYPGWTLTDNVYGVQYEYNDFTGWAVYLKLMKKE